MHMKRLALAVPALSLALSAPRAAHAQTPAAPEFVVNITATNAQIMPSLSMDARGNFVVVWESNLQDGSLDGVVGRRFDAAGVSVGTEFIVNTTTAGSQGDPDVSVDRRGEFVVAWTDYQGGTEIKARRFDRSGKALGAEFLVNAYGTGTQASPSVALDAGGNFVVVWESLGQDGNGLGVFGHRFGASGNSIGADFSVNTYVTGDQQAPDVVATADGGFVVVFMGPDTFASGVHARRFSAAGTAIGAEFSLTTAGATQFAPAAAALPQGGFVVAWTSYNQDGSHNGIFGRIFDGNGAPVTAEIPVNTFTTNAQSFPAVAADGNGGFVVIWESFLQDGSEAGVFGQRFTSAGARRGAEFQLNAFTSGAQMRLTVAADSAGSFVGAWDSASQDGSAGAVIDRRYQGLLPVSLALDTPGNGVFEANETVNFVPSWRNGTTATQSFTGALSNFTGPTPANYNIPDTAGNYGSVAAGATQSCNNGSNCYSLTITATTRPAAHWDAAVLETLAGPPNAAGLQRLWSVHVGDSFSDVPRSSGFYRFVETVLHHGVTSGCGAGTFCPADSTARDQMAVFVLVAREGAGYRPPDCGTPLFNDVPANSGFCRYVEELARRGVVGGCGNGNYCPSNPVTREQLCVFVLRTLDPTFVPPACGTPVFSDLPASSPFCPWCEELFNRGVVSGCGGGNFCPNIPVTREQTSVFLAVVFGLTLYGL
jgi:S-layer family protein